MCWRPTSYVLTARQSPRSDCRLATSRACVRTIGLRIRISRRDGASARCSASNHPDQPSASCPFTPLSSTPSTSSAISPPAPRSASSEKKRSRLGEPPPRPEPELGLPNCARPNSVLVTAPRGEQLGGRGRCCGLEPCRRRGRSGGWGVRCVRVSHCLSKLQNGLGDARLPGVSGRCLFRAVSPYVV